MHTGSVDDEIASGKQTLEVEVNIAIVVDMNRLTSARRRQREGRVACV